MWKAFDRTPSSLWSFQPAFNSMGPLLLFFGAFAFTVAWQLPGHYVPWLTFQQEFSAAVGAILIGGASLIHAKSTVKWPTIAVLALCTAVVPIAQWALGQILFVTDGVLAAAYVFGLGLCIAAGATLTRDQRNSFLDTLSLAFILGGIASTGLALAQWLGAASSALIEIPTVGRPFANLSQPNNLATLLWLAVCATIRLGLNGRIGRLALGVALLFLGWGLVLTQSRTAWLFAGALAGWMFFVRRRSKFQVSPTTIAGALVLFGAAVVALPSLNELLLITHRESVVARALGGDARITYWQMFTDAIGRSPTWGYGWTQTTLAHQAVVLDHPYTGHHVTYSHNIVLDLLVWNGLPIGLLLVGALVWWFTRHIRRCSTVDQAMLLAMVAAFGLHSMLEYPFSYAFFLLPMGLVMGALDELDDRSPSRQCRKLTLAVPLAGVTALVGVIGVEYPKLEQQTRDLRFKLAGYHVRGMEAQDLSFVGAFLMQRQLEFNRFVILKFRDDMTDKEYQWARNVTRRMPMAPLQMQFAVLAGINGRRDDASKALALLCHMGPPANCVSARKSWARLQQQYPKLTSIPPPDMPFGIVYPDL